MFGKEVDRVGIGIHKRLYYESFGIFSIRNNAYAKRALTMITSTTSPLANFQIKSNHFYWSTKQ